MTSLWTRESGTRGISILSLIPSRIENEGLKSTFSLCNWQNFLFILLAERTIIAVWCRWSVQWVCELKQVTVYLVFMRWTLNLNVGEFYFDSFGILHQSPLRSVKLAKETLETACSTMWDDHNLLNNLPKLMSIAMGQVWCPVEVIKLKTIGPAFRAGIIIDGSFWFINFRFIVHAPVGVIYIFGDEEVLQIWL